MSLLITSGVLSSLDALASLAPALAFDVALEPVARVTRINPLALFVPVVRLETLVLCW